jgi:hypothetical protein
VWRCRPRDHGPPPRQLEEETLVGWPCGVAHRHHRDLSLRILRALVAVLAEERGQVEGREALGVGGHLSPPAAHAGGVQWPRHRLLPPLVLGRDVGGRAPRIEHARLVSFPDEVAEAPELALGLRHEILVADRRRQAVGLDAGARRSVVLVDAHEVADHGLLGEGHARQREGHIARVAHDAHDACPGPEPAQHVGHE